MSSRRKLKTVSMVGSLAVLGFLATAAFQPRHTSAQDKTTSGHSKDGDKALADQIRVLQAKIAKLEAALKEKYPDASDPTHKKGMGGMMGEGMMGGMGAKNKGMAGMMEMMMGGMGGKKGMGDMMEMDMMQMEMMEMTGMMGMGSMSAKDMKGMKGKMRMTSALPGFPGASHLYHIGATDFFLDHPGHITLTTKQQSSLQGAKEKALLEKSTAQRKIDEAEQELWQLTGAEEPDAAKMEAKIRGIEKLRGDQRMAFIRSVGEAAKVLSAEQRQVLLGLAPSKADKDHVHPPK